MQDFEGRTAVITGAASGMGLAMAELFASQGMNVVLADVEKGALLAAKERVEARGVSALAVPTDVGSETEMDHLGAATREAFGPPDVLCLNAGVGGGGGPTRDLTTKDWRWTLDVNVYGVIHGLRVFLGDMQDRDTGHIVMTASVAGLTSYPGAMPYNASKHAVVTIAETLHAELAEAGSRVGVSCLCPGKVRTQIHASDRNRPKELVNESASEMSEEEAEAMRDYTTRLFADGKPPEEVAELVLAAIVEGRFWVQTDGFFREPIKARHRSIENDTPPPARGNILGVYDE